MNYALLDERNKAITNLFEQGCGVRLADLYSFFLMVGKIFFEITITNLLHDIVVISALHYVQHLHHIFRF